MELRYDPQGVSLRFRLPPDTLLDVTEDSDAGLVGRIGEIHKVATGTTALMIEDNIALATDMVESPTRLGASSVETARSIEAARRGRHDFAVLDMSLRGTTSFEVAELLRERNTPFGTGHGSAIDLPEALADVPIPTKPIDDGTLSACLGRILARPAGARDDDGRGPGDSRRRPAPPAGGHRGGASAARRGDVGSRSG